MSNDECVICPSCVHEFRAIPVSVQAELEALRKDAERYRKWRREYTANSWQDSGMLYALADAWSEDAVDAAIDAAMKDKP